MLLELYVGLILPALMSGLLLVLVLSCGQACLFCPSMPSQRLGTGEYLGHSWSTTLLSGAQGLAQGVSERGAPGHTHNVAESQHLLGWELQGGKKGVGVTHEAIPAGAKVSSESIPHTWTVPKKLHRTDILAVVAMGRERTGVMLLGCLHGRHVALRLSMLMASVALWPI